MGYRLAEQNGESVAVPRLVFAHLARADGDTIRAALYLLGGGGTDPRTMARDLGMPSIEAAKRAMQYWAGAGLLVSDRDAPLPKTEMQKASAIDLTTLNDPYVSGPYARKRRPHSARHSAEPRCSGWSACI